MKTISIKTINDKLDLIFGILGVILGLVILIMCYVLGISQQGIGLTVFFASLIYLLVRSKIKNRSDAITQFVVNFNPQNKIYLDILFYSVFLISMGLYYSQSYKRSIPYFILIVVLVALIAIEILYSKNEENLYSTLLKIILVSLNIRIGIYYAFPSLIGYDAYVHASISNSIISRGFVPPVEIIGKYASYPIFHLFISLTKMLCEANIKNAIFYSIGFASILITTFFVYLIGKKFVGSQVGLFSALLINLHNYNIVRGVANITPGSLVLCYLVVCLYLIFGKNQNVETKILVITITFIMIITHQLSTFVSLMVFMFLLVGIYISNMLHSRKISSFLGMNMNYIILFAVSVQAYWMYTYVHSGRSFFEMILLPLLSVLRSGSSYEMGVLLTGYEYQRPLLDTVLIQSCYLIMPFLVIGGVLLWFSSKDYQKYSFAFAISGLYAIIYVVPLIGMRNLLTTRWIPLLSILLVIVVSAYLFDFINIIKSNKGKLAVVLVVISVFTSLMLITPAINKDTPIIEKERTVRNQFKFSEIVAADTITNSYYGDIRLDTLFATCVRAYGNSSGDKFHYISREYIDSNSTEVDNGLLVVFRKSTLKEPITVTYGKLFGLTMNILLPENFYEKFESSNFDLVYSNGDIQCYITKQEEQ